MTRMFFEQSQENTAKIKTSANQMSTEVHGSTIISSDKVGVGYNDIMGAGKELLHNDEIRTAKVEPCRDSSGSTAGDVNKPVATLGHDLLCPPLCLEGTIYNPSSIILAKQR